MLEHWRDIPGFEGIYQISNLANVRRTQRGKRFSSEQVSEAKRMLQSGAMLKEVAAFLQTSITTVMSIKHGKTWAGEVTHRPVKPGTLNNGYKVVHLCREGKYERTLVHRAVWTAFNGAIPDDLEINHINHVRDDNRLDNLELLTHRENCQLRDTRLSV